MRVSRSFVWLAVLGGAAVAACTHDDPILTPVSRNGTDTIAVVTLAPAPAGFLNGNGQITYIASGPFDTSVVDAFARATGKAPYEYSWSGNCGGYDLTHLFIYAPGPSYAPFTPPNRFRPGMAEAGFATDIEGCGTTTAYIVPAANTGDGGNVWEVWHDFSGLTDGQRYVQGFARYAVKVNGALDISDLLLNGSVASADSLVFMAGDSNPAGRKADGVFTSSCASANIVHAKHGANPMLLGGGVAGSVTAASITIDQTICAIGTGADTVWGKNLDDARSPVARNSNAKPSPDQYNFFVLWQALADSTPDYTKPVYRLQIGPLIDVNGNVINNGYAPTPTAALTGAQLGPLPGSTSSIDSLKLTFTGLKPLTAGAYQVWVVNTGGANRAQSTGRVIRMAGGTVVDTLNGVSEFNLANGQDGARVEFSFASMASQTWDRAALVVQSTTGASTLAARPAMPLWAKITNPKPSGAAAQLAANMKFGSLDNAAADSSIFAAAGSGTGGFFGTELSEALARMQRPPIGYRYEAWLTNSTDTTKFLYVGGLTGPAPDYRSLTGADTSNAAPLSGAELTQAVLNYAAPTYGAFCTRSVAGSDTTLSPVYDRLSVRLGPKFGNTALLTKTVVLSGALGVPPGADSHKSQCTP